MRHLSGQTSQDHGSDGGTRGGIAPGKRTLTQGLAVQRKKEVDGLVHRADGEDEVANTKVRLLMEKVRASTLGIFTRVATNLQPLIERTPKPELAKDAHKHFEAHSGNFDGSVKQQKELAKDFAAQQPPNKEPEKARGPYNMWSGKKGLDQASKQPGFVVQETPEYAEGMWELRNIANVEDTVNFPWDPGYQTAFMREAEGSKDSKATFSDVPALEERLQHHKDAHVMKPEENAVIDDEGHELIGEHRAVSSSIFEPPSEVLARRAGRAMIPVTSFGLDSHHDPQRTIQAQVEIPVLLEEANKTADLVRENGTLRRELAELVADVAERERLLGCAERIQQAAMRYRTGARMLSPSVREEVRARSAEFMAEGRDMFEQSVALYDSELERLKVGG